jgi:hypothetical protein
MIQELGNDVVPIFAIGCTMVFLVVWVVAATIDSLHKTSRNARLKERMIEQGYSAAEIERVVEAKDTACDETSENTPVPPVKNRTGLHPRHFAQ